MVCISRKPPDHLSGHNSSFSPAGLHHFLVGLLPRAGHDPFLDDINVVPGARGLQLGPTFTSLGILEFHVVGLSGWRGSELVFRSQ